MNFSLEVVLHGEVEGTAARFERRNAGRGGVCVGLRNPRDLRAAGSGSRHTREAQGCAFLAVTSELIPTDRHVVGIRKVELLIAVASQSKLTQWVVQEVDRRDAELQLLPFRDL